MLRKIDYKRVYNVIKILILFISIILILYSLYLGLTYKKREQNTIRFTEMCHIAEDNNCGLFWENSRNIDNKMIESFILGILLPIVFFGSKSLINYIAPVVKKNEKN